MTSEDIKHQLIIIIDVSYFSVSDDPNKNVMQQNESVMTQCCRTVLLQFGAPLNFILQSSKLVSLFAQGGSFRHGGMESRGASSFKSNQQARNATSKPENKQLNMTWQWLLGVKVSYPGGQHF